MSGSGPQQRQQDDCRDAGDRQGKGASSPQPDGQSHDRQCALPLARQAVRRWGEQHCKTKASKGVPNFTAATLGGLPKIFNPPVDSCVVIFESL